MNLQVSYVGTKGTRLTIQQIPINNDNNIAPSILNDARAEFIRTGVNPLNALAPNPFFGVIPTANAALSGPQISRLNLARAFPALGSVALFQNRTGSSSYHALQASVTRRFSGWFEAQGNYTWSKTASIEISERSI